MTWPIATGVSTCSGCAGDYEDPERAMWDDESDDDGGEQDGVEDADRHHPREGFPVRES